jgi:hypothetical protein
MDQAAVGVDRCQSRIEFDAAIEIGERSWKTTPLAKGNSPIGIGKWLAAGY